MRGSTNAASKLETRPRYTPTTVWDSFPWPQSPTPTQDSRIAAASAAIQEAREGYLEQGITLTEMYDALREPGASRFRDIHEELDGAVLAAYAFSASDDLLAQLLALNYAYAEDPDATAALPGAPVGKLQAYASTYRLAAEPLH